VQRSTPVLVRRFSSGTGKDQFRIWRAVAAYG